MKMGTFFLLGDGLVRYIVLGIMSGKIFDFVKSSESPIYTLVPHFTWFIVRMWLCVVVGWDLTLLYYIGCVCCFRVHQRFFWRKFFIFGFWFFLLSNTNLVFFPDTGRSEFIQPQRLLWKVVKVFETEIFLHVVGRSIWLFYRRYKRH